GSFYGDPVSAQAIENFRDVVGCLGVIIFHQEAVIAAKIHIALFCVKEAGTIDSGRDKRARDRICAPGRAEFVVLWAIRPPGFVPFSDHERTDALLEIWKALQVCAKRARFPDDDLRL